MANEWKAGTGQQIEKLYAWIADEGTGGEGIIGALMPTGRGGVGWTPLIGADRARIESYRHIAEAAAKAAGKTVYLKVFGAGVVIEKIEP